MKKKNLIIFGTRPEAIKMAPLVKEFKKNTSDFEEIKKRLESSIIFDGRNQYNLFDLPKRGFEYYQIGK